ncbi:hypothetical protein ACIRBZ_47820, partial [Streptomyces sp. NPDC094038]|uniref:hypothetical protein n=1 Tax=Streptomyces sp. NPDC094038 TaxID=3366055 RepID=UPI00382033A7
MRDIGILAPYAAGNLVTFTDAAGRQTLCTYTYTYTYTGLLKTSTDNSHAVTTWALTRILGHGLCGLGQGSCCHGEGRLVGDGTALSEAGVTASG